MQCKHCDRAISQLPGNTWAVDTWFHDHTGGIFCMKLIGDKIYPTGTKAEPNEL